MSGVWYTSDLHLGHAGCATFRGFESTDHHDATIINNWNDLVEPGDTVWVLGDVCLSRGSLQTVSLLNGRKHLIAGNHDAVFPGDRKAAQHQRHWLQYFETVQAFARRKVNGVEFLLSHFPYAGDHGSDEHDATDRYTQYRLRNEGMALVHGHLHCPEIYSHERPRQVHVGLDAWQLRPAAQEVVVALLEEVCGGQAREAGRAA